MFHSFSDWCCIGSLLLPSFTQTADSHQESQRLCSTDKVAARAGLRWAPETTLDALYLFFHPFLELWFGATRELLPRMSLHDSSQMELGHLGAALLAPRALSMCMLRRAGFPSRGDTQVSRLPWLRLSLNPAADGTRIRSCLPKANGLSQTHRFRIHPASQSRRLDVIAIKCCHLMFGW